MNENPHWVAAEVYSVRVHQVKYKFQLLIPENNFSLCLLLLSGHIKKSPKLATKPNLNYTLLEVLKVTRKHKIHH